MKSILTKLRAIFINGLLVVLPVGLTLYILWMVYRFINNFTGRKSYLGGLISDLLQATLGIDWFPGIGVILTALVVMLIGLATRIYIGRKVYELLDRVIAKAPLISKMYATVKQITGALLNRDVSSFRDVVTIEYPRRGIYSVGFLTNQNLGKFGDTVGEDLVAVFIFSTPNPLTGMITFVPRSDVYHLDLSVEEGLRLVLSMGIVVPASFREKNISKTPGLKEEN
ncbi:MAG: DUF502 domain-containing protein [Candidatus Bipolaricaulota bacterium]